ncbi:hypothetical protein [Lysinibacillus xylanilyticus]|uniref:hypothetical protein n=1 Tax=Lysinibacillus xylanilyticus TaxID=582475 RepID=UPI003D080BA9
MALELHNTENPISNSERLKINENWQRIISGYSYLQQQIKVLAGGAEVDELIQRLNEAVDNANVAVQEAIDANNTATQEAIEANNTALQTALDTVSQTLVQMNEAVTKANTATSDANTAKQGALDATTQAQAAINKMQSMIDNLRSRGEWDVATQYYTNNIVTFNNNSYIALQDGIGRTPPTAPLQVNTYWSLLAGQGLKGDRGEKGDTGAALSILGRLTDVSQLPPVGNAGDAYTVNGDLYVWSENLNEWENVGNIKGEKGEKGDTGATGKTAYQEALDNGFSGTEAEWLASLKGEKGDTPDLTEVTEHLDDNAKHLQAGERTKITNALQPNTYSASNTITNIGHYKATRVFPQINWSASGVELWESTISLTKPVWGLLELDIAGYSAGSGGAKIVIELGINVTSTSSPSVEFRNVMKVVTASAGFTDNFYVQFQHRPESRILLIQIFKRVYNDPVTVSATFTSTASNQSAFEFLSGFTVGSFYSNGVVIPSTLQKDFDTRIKESSVPSLPASTDAVLGAGWSVRPIYSLKYYKDAFGVVHLYGRVDRNGGGTLITTLPVGYRPLALFETGVTQGVTGHTYIEIFPDGRVNAPNGVADNTNILIECSFRTT